MNIPIPLGAKNVTVDFDTPTPPPVNQVPVVDAGKDQAFVLPLNSATLSGVASDPDGVITNVIWEVVSGTGQIANPNQLTTKVSGLSKGTNVFRLSVTDNQGAASKPDEVSITLTDAPLPPTPGYVETFRNPFNTQADLTTNNGQYGNGKVITVGDRIVFNSRPAYVSSGMRSEWQTSGSSQNPEEGALEYDVMYRYIVQNNCHSLQSHPSTDGGSGSPAILHEDGTFDIVNQDTPRGSWTHHRTGIKIIANKWYKVRLEFKFGNGYVRFFLDGVLISKGSWTGKVGDGSGHYWKIGFNGAFDGDNNEAGKSDILYDNVVFYKKV